MSGITKRPDKPFERPTKRVLIVDDEETIRQVLTEFFNSFSHGTTYKLEARPKWEMEALTMHGDVPISS